MSKKFNGERCERRNLTDLVLGTGPTGMKRPVTKKKQPAKSTVPQMNYGGPFIASDYYANLANANPEMVENGAMQAPEGFEFPTEGGATMTPGQFPEFMKQYLAKQGNMSLASSAGQSAGQFITQNSDTVGDPMANFGVGEGLGAAVSGAANPFAMSFGPAGMVVGAGVGLLKARQESNMEKNRFIAEEERLSGMRTAANVANAQDFSRQALSTYDQDGAGGGYYSKYGGPVDRFYMGGATKRQYPHGGGTHPPVIPGMEQYAQYNNLNPDLAAAVANRPETSDRLTNYTNAEQRRYNNIGNQTRINSAVENARNNANTFATNTYNFHKEQPLDALGMDLAIAGQLPIVGEAADLLNAGISGARGFYNTAVGDTAKAKEQYALATLSGLSAIPIAGNVTGAARIGKGLYKASHGAHKLERGVIGAKGVKAGTYESYAMGGPIDYETEKEEVILASPYDRPVAPGQGSYNQLSENLFKGNGPSHAQGGIPTRGATQPFVDAGGQPVDSPYVFSDSKDMKFDPNDILSMIT